MRKEKCSRGLILDIGCGEKKVASNAIGLDVRRTKAVDIIADARLLPFRDEVFDVVYSSHVIEHFSHREVKDVVREWVRVLKRGGTIEIRCPWLSRESSHILPEANVGECEEHLWRTGERVEFPQVRLLFWASETALRGVWDRKGQAGNRKRFLRVPFLSDLHVKGIKK